LKIVLDPGHSPQSYGTIGPLGNTEASVTSAVALVVKRELEKKGADVILTHDANQDVSLKSRTDLAWKSRAHIFISLHCDATPEGQDPRPSQGYSVHYYSPQSRELAEAIHDTYGKKTGVTDQGLWRSNLSVCRMTQMPSVLLEMAFLVLPEYEEMLLKPSFQETVAEALSSSIVTFVNETK
jgi:N-acetylmuramoyl-L-alanine amidase